MSSDELRAQADRIFQLALDASPDDRQAVVDRACDGNEELRQIVVTLLSYVDDTATAGFDPADALGAALGANDLLERPATAPRRGETFGGFRLVRKLGEGGMGEVWEAEQSEPIRRRVALKLLRPGVRSASIVARFRSERQALAMMQHAYIAQIFEAGTSDADRPFLVMELVAGTPITEFCEERGLDRVERLRLFMKACAGVQHAHRRGIIHRDLKPSNVLVSEAGGEFVPKIIDFGLAKPTEGTLFEETMTLDGQVLGTPAYMSPEQTHPEGAGVDTRTDVYALGAILYELLSGSRPHENLTGASIDDVLRTIREVDPRRPSLAAKNGRSLRGDLDWITMKALAKERERRYESPADLAADLERYLDGHPVEAGPPSARYRAGKFVRRHALAMSASAVAFLLLTAFTVALGLQNRRIARERDRANEEADVAAAVTDFLVGLFHSPDPIEGTGRDVTALSILDEGATHANELETVHPETQVRLLQTMGEAFAGLGELERSAGLLERAVEISAGIDTVSIRHANVLRELADTYDSQGQYVAAEEIRIRAFEMARNAPVRDRSLEAQMLNSLSRSRWRQGDPDQARTYLEESIRLQEAVDPRGAELPRSLNNLAILAWQAGDFETARTHLKRALSLWEETLGPEHPNVASTYGNLALTYQEEGDNEASLPYHQRALEIRERTLGPDHPDVAESLNNMANAYRDLGRFDEALALLKRALAIREAALGPDHDYTATTVYNLGATLLQMERPEEARPYLERSLAVMEQSLGPEHPNTSYPLLDLAQVHALAGNTAQARDYFARCATIRVAGFPAGSELRRDALAKFAGFEREQGHGAVADSLLALIGEGGS